VLGVFAGYMSIFLEYNRLSSTYLYLPFNYFNAVPQDLTRARCSATFLSV